MRLQQAHKTLQKRLGKGFVDKVLNEIILEIGQDQFSKQRLVLDGKTGNFAAARRLNRELNALGVASRADLAHLDPLVLAERKGVGETTVYVLMCVQDALDQDPLTWERTWRSFVKANRNGGRVSAKRKGRKRS